MHRALTGPRLAFAWLTVLPVRGPLDIARDDARRAIASTPLVGIVLGGIASVMLWGLANASLDTLVAGLLTVGTLALLTRGMHIDGLADTADGLGCYGPPERAREVMRSGSAGPFGVATMVLVLGIQAAGFAALAQTQSWWAVVVAVVVGRVAVVIVCRRGVAAASETGFGALVADSQSRIAIAAWTAVALIAASFAIDGRWWQGPLVVALALTVTTFGARHCTRRFGGVSGDVLGATVEVATVLVVVGLLLGG